MNNEPVAELLESSTAFHGRVFDVHHDRVKLPNGRDVHMDVVRHAPSISLLAMPDEAHVVLIRQYRYSVNRWLWEVPAGSVDEGETPEQAAVRECHEEIGLVPHEVRPLGVFLPTPGICDEVMHFFLVRDLREPEAEAEADEDEMIVPQTLSLAEARAMVARGEITDMKTAFALTLLR